MGTSCERGKKEKEAQIESSVTFWSNSLGSVMKLRDSERARERWALLFPLSCGFFLMARNIPGVWKAVETLFLSTNKY